MLILSGWSTFSVAADVVEQLEQDGVLRFEITEYVLENATLLEQSEIDSAAAPFMGKGKDFSDVQGALEAIEEVYASKGYSAIRILMPEQELNKGKIHFRVVESLFGKVEVKDNRYVSEANVMNALPSVRSGGVPHSRQIARELKLANENPSRQLNVILRAAEKDDQVDARVVVTDSPPSSWGVSVDNTGSTETGPTRLSISYRHANLFDADHVLGIQYATSPQHPQRVKVVGVTYKVPLYQFGGSLEYFLGYSNVNALMNNTFDNFFQGGGFLLGAKYNYLMDRVGRFDPRISVGIDRRHFRDIELVNSDESISVYNEIVVLPVSVTFSARGKFDKSDANFNLSYAINLPGVDKGRKSNFLSYDASETEMPDSYYHLIRYGASYALSMGDRGGQFRAALNGQWSGGQLIQGEQVRLGGAEGVRGFSEGSEGGEIGAKLNLEGYSPDFGRGDIGVRAVVFYDRGYAKPFLGTSSTIASMGVGLRANYAERYLIRLDGAQIKDEGVDSEQRVGDWRWHASLVASF
jgi:hemolysin activation/secretion protein